MNVIGISPATSGQGGSTLSNSRTIQDKVTEESQDVQGQPTTGQENCQINKDDAQKLTDQFNNLMETTKTTIRFQLGECNEPLMVQVINAKTGRVIQEIPSERLLDIGMKVSSYVGILLDQHA